MDCPTKMAARARFIRNTILSTSTAFSVQNINAENSVGYAEISVGFAENSIGFAENSALFSAKPILF